MKEIMSCHYQIINNIEYRKQFYEVEEYVRTKLPNTNMLVIQKILYMKMRFCTELFTLEMI